MHSPSFRTIIPCAGLGTRVGMKPHESKELLPDPVDGRPLIEWTLDRAVNPLIILRKEKTDLINYCNERGLQYMVVPETREWPETVLCSKMYWREQNLLLLPDTRFTLTEKLYHETNDDLLFGIHTVDDISKFGEVNIKSCYTQEKPNRVEPGTAWGLIKFHKDIGTPLFASYLYKTKFKLKNCSAFWLSNFKDITRNGTVEMWKP